MLTKFLKCFHGHPAEEILQRRKELVDKFHETYPKYFNIVADICAGDLKDDDIKQIRYGNTGLILRLPDIYEYASFETKEGKDYKNLKNICNSTVIDDLKQSINEFIEKAKVCWIEQGNEEDTFSLDTFSWGEKEESFSKKERRSLNPASYIRLRDVVIPTKQNTLDQNKLQLVEMERKYKESAGYLKYQCIKTYINTITDCIKQSICRYEKNAISQIYDVENMASTTISCAWTRYRHRRQQLVAKMIDATTKSMTALNLADDGDGGFELSVVEDEFIFNQWYPQIKDKIRKSYENEVDNINDFIDNLGIKTNLSYFVKHQKKKKYWFSGSAEQDLIIYHKPTNKVVACGEVKKNYYDIVHADHQLERDKVIISGVCSNEKYKEYTVDTIIDRFVADPKNKDTPDFKTADFDTYLNKNTLDFIITMPKEMQQTVPFCSKIATQVTHKLFSSSFTPIEFINKKIELYKEGLNLTSLPAVLETKSIFIVKMQNSINIQAAEGVKHLQAQTVLSNLEANYPEWMADLQTKMKEITDMANGNVASGLIDMNSLGINTITCNLPRDGTKAIVASRIDDGTWFKNFTGNEWRMDYRRIGGDTGHVEVPVEKMVVDFTKNESNVWELTNATTQPKTDLVTFGPSKRGVNIAHLVACNTNPTLMNGNFQKGDEGGYSIVNEDTFDKDMIKQISLGEQAVTLMKDAIMPVSNVAENTLNKPARAEIDPEADNIVLRAGEESKCGDGDRFAAYIISEEPIFKNYVKVFGEERQHLAIMIGKDGEEHLWAKCEDHWETLINCFAEVCKHTLGEKNKEEVELSEE